MIDARLYNEPCCNCLLSLRNWYTPRWGKGRDEIGNSPILFITDIPGITEYRSQIHYSGKYTSVLNKFIEQYKLTEYCVKTHLIKCYNPKAERKYARKCIHNIIKDIKETKPIIIISCGKLVYETLTDKEVYNMWSIINKPVRFANSILIPILHPSYITRNNKEDEYKTSFTLISDLYARANSNYALFR